jgi:hypothetical protein
MQYQFSICAAEIQSKSYICNKNEYMRVSVLDFSSCPRDFMGWLKL